MGALETQLLGAAWCSAHFHEKKKKKGLEVPDFLIFKKQPEIQFKKKKNGKAGIF